MALRAGALCPTSSTNMSTHICALISADEADQAKFLIIILNIVEDEREIARSQKITRSIGLISTCISGCLKIFLRQI